METSNRILFLDSLRTFAIIMVIFYHVTFEYVQGFQFFPFVKNTITDDNAIYYVLTLLFNDKMLNSIIFFIAGYFALGPLFKNGAVNYLKGKLVRLGIPYVVGFLLIVPVMKNIAITSWGYEVGDWYLGSLKPENVSPLHFWFIGVLLIFFSILSLIYVIFRNRFESFRIHPQKFPVTYTVLFIAAVSVIYFVLSLFFNGAYFVNLYVIYFQAVMILIYAAYFLLGIYAYKNDWFKEGYKPAIIPWAVSYAVSIGIYVLLNINTNRIFAGIGNTLTNAVVSIVLNVSIYSALMVLLALFQKYANVDSRLLRGISGCSYTIYMVHYVIVYALIYFTRDIPVIQVLRYIAQFAVAVALSFGISYILKKVPVVNRAL